MTHHYTSSWKRNSENKLIAETFTEEIYQHPLFGAWMGFRDRSAKQANPNSDWVNDIFLFEKSIPNYPTDGIVYKLMMINQSKGYVSDNVEWVEADPTINRALRKYRRA